MVIRSTTKTLNGCAGSRSGERLLSLLGNSRLQPTPKGSGREPEMLPEEPLTLFRTAETNEQREGQGI